MVAGISFTPNSNENYYTTEIKSHKYTADSTLNICTVYGSLKSSDANC